MLTDASPKFPGPWFNPQNHLKPCMAHGDIGGRGRQKDQRFNISYLIAGASKFYISNVVKFNYCLSLKLYIARIPKSLFFDCFKLIISALTFNLKLATDISTLKQWTLIYYIIVFCGARDQIQGEGHAGSVLYHSAASPP